MGFRDLIALHSVFGKFLKAIFLLPRSLVSSSTSGGVLGMSHQKEAQG